MRQLIAALFLIVAALVGQPARAQDDRFMVTVEHTGEDSIGRLFTYEIREVIRRSAGYRLVDPGTGSIQILIVTHDPLDRRSTSDFTVASVVVTVVNLRPYDANDPSTWLNYYLSSWVVTVGRDRTAG